MINNHTTEQDVLLIRVYPRRWDCAPECDAASPRNLLRSGCFWRCCIERSTAPHFLAHNQYSNQDDQFLNSKHPVTGLADTLSQFLAASRWKALSRNKRNLTRISLLSGSA